MADLDHSLEQRPGEVPTLFTQSLLGGPASGRDPLAVTFPVIVGLGKTARLTAPGKIAMRNFVRFDPARAYVLLGFGLKFSNSGAPATDTYKLGVAWYDKDGAALGGAEEKTELATVVGITIAQGLVKLSGRLGLGSGVAQTANQIYGLPYVEGAGGGWSIDIEVVAHSDITDDLFKSALVHAPLRSRPGDRPDLFTSAPAGGDPALLTPLDPSLAIDTDQGRVIRSAAPLDVAQIGLTRIEPGQLYAVRGAVTRRVNMPDPFNATVGLRVLWYDGDKTYQGESIVHDIEDVLVGDGRTALLGTIGAGTTLVPSATQVYARAWIRLYGSGGSTDFEVCDIVGPAESALSLAAQAAVVKAEDAAARAQLYGGDIVASPGGYAGRQLLVNEDGKAVIDIAADVWAGDVRLGNRGFVYAAGGKAGLDIRLEAEVDAGVGAAPSNAYARGFSSIIWTEHWREPAPFKAHVSLARRQRPSRTGETLTVHPTTGVIIPSGLAANRMRVGVADVHSDGQGALTDAPLTTASPVPGKAYMISNNSVAHPDMGVATPTALVDFGHAVSHNKGETPWGGLLAAWLGQEAVNGTAIATCVNSVGVGGAALRNFLNPITLDWEANFARVLETNIKIVEEAGYEPLPAPHFLFQFDPSNSGPRGDHISVKGYFNHLIDYHRRRNELQRRVFNLHPEAPPLPVFTSFCTEGPNGMWDGTQKKFGHHLGSVAIAQYAHLVLATGVIPAGVTSWAPVGPDGQHHDDLGYYLYGHQIGMCLADWELLRSWLPPFVYGCTRIDATNYDLLIAFPQSHTIVFDGTNPTPLNGLGNTQYGLETWNENTETERPLAGLALTQPVAGTAKLRCAWASDPGPFSSMIADWGLRGDDATEHTKRDPRYCPRTNIRGNTLQATPQGSYYRTWLAPGRMPIPKNNGATFYAHQTIEEYL